LPPLPSREIAHRWAFPCGSAIPTGRTTTPKTLALVKRGSAGRVFLSDCPVCSGPARAAS